VARFYGSIKGNRCEATRTGTRTSGLCAHIRGWDIGVAVNLYVDPITGRDVVEVRKTGGSNGSTPEAPLATLYGPFPGS
jgi:hypothetical protein